MVNPTGHRPARITLLQLGVGTVGGEVLRQVRAHHGRWSERLGFDVVFGGVAGRAGALIAAGDRGLDDRQLARIVEARRATGTFQSSATESGGLVTVAEAVDTLASRGPLVVIDAAAGERTAELDARALERGAGVVLSNKAPLALPSNDPRSVVLWAETGPGGRLRYEATCGAGLPVISTLRALLDTGDEPIAITGALSGTMGAIFSDVAGGMPFSAAVRAAKERGYTEPDPRDDLSGLDVARKALILARTMGRPVDLSDIAVESLVPPDLVEVSVAEFLDRVSVGDDEIATMGREAMEAGAALKYVATVPAEGAISVGLRQVPKVTVLGALQGPENIVSICTRRYDDYPCVVSGPGAGAEVTAAGILADVLALCPALRADA
ncbi:MAG: homoserine dehydrogenase [Chloroflexia bacterium]|nr:homoserine dehydrogenase [Chloroflexia bacterium]